MMQNIAKRNLQNLYYSEIIRLNSCTLTLAILFELKNATG